jgi:hypothetical protein
MVRPCSLFAALVLASLAVFWARGAVADGPVVLSQPGDKAGSFSLGQVSTFNLAAIRSRLYPGSVMVRRPNISRTLFWPLICQGKCPPYSTTLDPRSGNTIYPVIVRSVTVEDPKTKPHEGFITLLDGGRCVLRADVPFDSDLLSCLKDDIDRQALGIDPLPVLAAPAATTPKAEVDVVFTNDEAIDAQRARRLAEEEAIDAEMMGPDAENPDGYPGP